MSESRARILARLRHAPRASDAASPSFPIARLHWDEAECMHRFRSGLEAVHGEVREVGDDWPAVLHDLLRERGARNLGFGPRGPEGAALLARWPDGDLALVPYESPVESFRETLFDRIDAGFTACRGAVAETGTLVLWPDEREPRLLSLVPPIHVVLLYRDAIRSTLAELIAEQGWAGGLPANAVLATGPSRSADIEQTLAYGVHGPKELIVLVATRVARATG